MSEPNEMTPADRLKAAIKATGLSQRALAFTIGVAPQSLTNALRRKRVSPELARAVGRKSGYRWEWILTGEGGATAEDADPTRPVSQLTRQIPVIDLATAWSWPRVARDQSEQGEMTVDSETAASLGNDAFCLVVEDDSMRDASPESIQRGDRIVIDPSIDPEPGDLVVATVASQKAAIFRKFRDRGRDAHGIRIGELVPLNPDYAPINGTLSSGLWQGEIKIIGVMVEHRRVRRPRA